MKKIWFLFFVTAFAAGSCKKQLDINYNPPTEVSSNSVLIAALVGTASNNANNYLGLTRWMGYWARGGDFPPDEQTETYNLTNAYTDHEWANLYGNLNTYDYMEKIGRTNALPFYVGVAKVMKAYCFSTLVDLYNDVPYKEAFQESTKNQPVYDQGQEIYNDLVGQLDSAIIYFENARAFYKVQPASIANTDDQYDVMFGSARTKAVGYNARLTLWEKFTNTLELKLLMHQSQIGAQQAFIQEEIRNITTSKGRAAAGFIGAGESATVNPGYQQSTGKINPLFGLFYNVDGSPTMNFDYYRLNTNAFNFYRNGNDRRIELYDGQGRGILMPGGNFLGDTGYIFFSANDSAILYNYINGPVIVVYHSDTIPSNLIGSNYDGDPAALPHFFSDGVGSGLLKGFNQDQFIFSDFESLFLQAEAVQRGYLTGNAQTLYESAITQNFVYILPPNTNFNDPVIYAKDYFTQGLPDIDWAASPNKLEAILTQKWAAMNGVNWVEAYNDYRRTGYPASSILGISHAPTHVQPMIPVRFLYPQSELNTNAAHVPQLGANAQFTAKIFWDQ